MGGVCQSSLAQHNSELEAMLGTHPDKVVATVEKKLQSSEALERAEQAYYQTLLSDAYYSLYQPDKALKHALSAVALAEHEKHNTLYQRALLSKALALGLGAKAEESLPIAQGVLEWAREHNDLELEVGALRSIGFSALSLSEYTLALDAMQQAYTLLKKNQNQGLPHYARFAAYLAQVYDFRGEPSYSLPLYLEAADYSREQDRELELSDALYGAARAYSQLGKPKQAIILFEQSMALSRKLGDAQGGAYTLIELAKLNLQHPELTETSIEKTITDLFKARELFTQAGNAHLIMEVDKIVVEAFLSVGKLEKATETLKHAQGMVTRDSLRSSEPELLRLEARIQLEKGNSAFAYERLSQAYILREKMLERSREEEFERLRAEFNIEQREIENQLLSEQNARQQIELDLAGKQNTIVMLITLLLIVAIGCMLFFLRNLRIQKDHLARLASRDPLTGVYNRRAILAYLETVKQKREGDVGVAMLDLDNFKKINDTYGHQAGDAVLTAAASKAKVMLSQYCRAGRIGGEEFLFVFNPTIGVTTCHEYLVRYTERMKQRAKSIASIKQTPVTFSIGLTMTNGNEDTSATLARADALMYRAKEQGKDNLVADRK